MPECGSLPRPQTNALRVEAAAAFTSVQEDAIEGAHANGFAGWLGGSIAYRASGAIEGTAHAFELLCTVAPVVTLLAGDARRLSLLARPGVAMHYGWFAFSFGMNLELALGQTDSGPTFSPGANVGLGLAF